MPRVTGGGQGVTLELERHEADLLRGLVDEMAMLLDHHDDRDDVVQRILPDAYEDPQEEKKYRELVGDDVLRAKLDGLREARDALGQSGGVTLELGPERVGPWLALLTDMRLAIGTRLQVTPESMETEIDPENEDAAAYSVLHWLGWVQGTILERLNGGTDA